MRTAEISRKTAETEITLRLALDGTGISRIETGVGFLDHMLTLFASHGRFDMVLSCTGDTRVDDHHTVEDVGIALGRAFRQALGDKRGICRYGDKTIPMDETLILAAVDLSGRDYLGYSLQIPTEKVGTFDTELVEEFFLGFGSAFLSGFSNPGTEITSPAFLHYRQILDSLNHLGSPFILLLN